MPLNWHFEPGTIFDPQASDKDGNLLSKYAFLIIYTKSVGVSRITEDNVEEFARRVALYEQVIGYGWSTDKGPQPYTLEDCRNLIGLRTNATGIKKTAFDAWMKKEKEEIKRYAARRDGGGPAVHRG